MNKGKKKKMNDDDWGNLKSAAAVADVNPKTFREWIDKGLVPKQAVKEYGERIVRVKLSEAEKLRHSGRKPKR